MAKRNKVGPLRPLKYEKIGVIVPWDIIYDTFISRTTLYYNSYFQTSQKNKQTKTNS